MSWSTCKKCGDKIFWARMPAGNYLPMDPDGGGFHECTPFRRTESNYTPRPSLPHATAPAPASAPKPEPAASWSFKEQKSRATFPIPCWWCGDPVFFHTNGYGDCVLFDRLGWPWQVHDCWLRHRDQQPEHLARFEKVLIEKGYKGQFIEPSGKRIAGPPPGKADHLVKVQGYVANNNSFYDDARALTLGKSGGWFQIDVADVQGNLYPFLVPEEAAGEIEDYMLVLARGCWMKIEGTWRLVATAFDGAGYLKGESRSWRMAASLAKRRCSFCRRPLKSVTWSLNEVFRPECEGCTKLRGDLTPLQFMRIARWIARGWPGRVE